MPFANNKGVRLHWEAAGEGTPVLLIMGHSYTATMWYPIHDALAAKHRVISFDNRGTGESDTTADATIADLVADSLAVMEAAGVDKAHVFGVSMGGGIALLLGIDKMMQQFGLCFSDNVHVIDPVGFLEMIALLNACRIVITDSGGLQKEAYILRRPTVTVRDSTEWVETVQSGWNRLCEPDPRDFNAAVSRALRPPPTVHPDFYGSYGVSQRICRALEINIGQFVREGV